MILWFISSSMSTMAALLPHLQQASTTRKARLGTNALDDHPSAERDTQTGLTNKARHLPGSSMYAPVAVVGRAEHRHHLLLVLP